MSKKYIPGHVIDECRDLRRHGERLETLAGRLDIPPDELAELLGESRPVQSQAAEFDLWRTDELNARL